MATIKVACPECGQRVSGDETFYGKTVDCPVCHAVIRFPEGEEDDEPAARSESAAPKTASGAEPRRAERERAAEAVEKPVAGAETEPARLRVPALHRASAPVMPATSPRAARPRSTAGPKTPERTSSAAVWSLIFGIAALVSCFLGLIFAIPAIVCGHIGRGNIERSLGRLGGHGLATGGLMLGYFHIILVFLLVVAVPWKPIFSFGLQRYNEQSARTIADALQEYAGENAGEFPAQLDDLVPDFLAMEKFQATRKWIDPENFPMFSLSPFIYHAGHTTGDDQGTVLLAAPKADAANRRMICRLSGAIELISEDDYFRDTP